MTDWLKHDSWILDQKNRIKEIWTAADRDYTPDFGSNVVEIIDFGKVIPPNAKSPKFNKLSAMGQKDLDEASKVEKPPQPGVLTVQPSERHEPQDEPTPQPESFQ